MKKIMSWLLEIDKIMVPVPENERLTEEGLITLERQIAQASRKNEFVQELSMKYAEMSDVCEMSPMLSDESEIKKLRLIKR